MMELYSAIHYPKTNKKGHTTHLFSNYLELKKALLVAEISANPNVDSPYVQVLLEQEYEQYNRMISFANSWFRPADKSLSGADYECTFELQYPWPVLVIEDNNLGGSSVTNKILQVVKEVERHTEINLANKPIVYMDSMGLYSQILYDGTNAPIKTIQTNKVFSVMTEAVETANLHSRNYRDTSIPNLLNFLFANSDLKNPLQDLHKDQMVCVQIGNRSIALTSTVLSDSKREYNLTEWKNDKVNYIFVFAIAEPFCIKMEFFSQEEPRIFAELEPSDYRSVERHNDFLKSFLLRIAKEKIERNIENRNV